MKRKLLIAFAAAMALTGALAGGAYAYWTAHGTGSGTASVGAPLSVTVQAASGTPSSALLPSGTADLLVQVTNPNAYPVTIVGVSQNLSETVSVSGGTGCTAANAGVAVPTQVGLTVSIAPGPSVVVHIPSGASMTAGSAGGCQGASFQIPVTLTVQR
jgi:hypothetical protein